MEDYVNPLYCYNAFVTKVYDGDTITCNIDLGFGVEMKKQKIRLFGINTPEVRGESKEEGHKSRDYLRDMILDKNVKLYTIKNKKGKYGRWLGIVKVGDLESGEINCNQLLIDEGLAKEYML